MSKIAVTVSPEIGSGAPTVVTQSTLPRRVQISAIRRRLGGRPIRSSVCLRNFWYMSSADVPGQSGTKNDGIEGLVSAVMRVQAE